MLTELHEATNVALCVMATNVGRPRAICGGTPMMLLMMMMTMMMFVMRRAMSMVNADDANEGDHYCTEVGDGGDDDGVDAGDDDGDDGKC